MFDSRVFFVGVTALVAAERLLELWLSKKNARRTLDRGGIEHRPSAHWIVVALQVAWLGAAPFEVWLFDRPWQPILAAICIFLVFLAMLLRYWAVTTLGDRWNTRIITVPGEAPVTTGPYRYLRHPNYLAAFVELFALPLVHGAWLSAIVLGTANLLAMHLKAGFEERALDQHAPYAQVFSGRNRYLPGGR
jgi:methyltransferase